MAEKTLREILRLARESGLSDAEIGEIARDTDIGGIDDSELADYISASSLAPREPNPDLYRKEALYDPMAGLNVPLGIADAGASVAASIPNMIAEGYAGLAGTAYGAVNPNMTAIEGGMAGMDFMNKVLPQYQPTQGLGQDILSTPPMPQIEAGLEKARNTLGDFAFDAGSAIDPSLGPIAGTGGYMFPEIATSGIGGVLRRASGNRASDINAKDPLAGVSGGEVFAETISDAVPASIDQILSRLPFNKRAEIKELAAEGVVDSRAVGFDVEPPPEKSLFGGEDSVRVTRSQPETDAVKAGVPEDRIKSIVNANDETKAVMDQMIDRRERGFYDADFSLDKPSEAIIGDQIINKLRPIFEKNKSAGEAIDKIAEKDLKGKILDGAVVPFKNFRAALEAEGIKFKSKSDDSGTYVEPDFDNSSFEIAKGGKKLIKDVLSIMKQGREVDALALHKLKRMLDDRVTYGKTQQGLTGKSERIIKDLRREIDGLLDDNFKDYKLANDDYSTTKGFLDDFKRATGKVASDESGSAPLNIDFDRMDESLGRASRRLLTNQQNAEILRNLVDKMTGLSKNYGYIDNIDITPLILLQSTFKPLFGVSADKSNSLFGDVSSAAQAVAGNPIEMINQATKVEGLFGYKARQQTPEARFKALKGLTAPKGKGPIEEQLKPKKRPPETGLTPYMN